MTTSYKKSLSGVSPRPKLKSNKRRSECLTTHLVFLLSPPIKLLSRVPCSVTPTTLEIQQTNRFFLQSRFDVKSLEVRRIGDRFNSRAHEDWDAQRGIGYFCILFCARHCAWAFRNDRRCKLQNGGKKNTFCLLHSAENILYLFVFPQF